MQRFQHINDGNLFQLKSLQFIQRPTKRALDAGESAAISSSFLHLSLFPLGRGSPVRPSASNANR
jgi:hypothetical protein